MRLSLTDVTRGIITHCTCVEAANAAQGCSTTVLLQAIVQLCYSLRPFPGHSHRSCTCISKVFRQADCTGPHPIGPGFFGCRVHKPLIFCLSKHADCNGFAPIPGHYPTMALNRLFFCRSKIICAFAGELVERRRLSAIQSHL